MGKHSKYERAVCLISNEFAYFGNNGDPSIGEIKDIYINLPRDYVKNHDVETRNRLLNYINNIFNKFGHGKHGKPTHSDLSKKCNNTEDDVIQFSNKCQ